MSKVKKIKQLSEFKSVTPKLLELLIEAGLDDTALLVRLTASELAEAVHIPIPRASKVIDEALSNVPCFFETGWAVYSRRKNIKRLSSGVKSIDALLEGGFETKTIIELYGQFAAGKTALMHTLSVLVQLPYEQGGLGGSAVYVDTENTFRPEKIIPIAERFGLDAETVLKNIHHKLVMDVDEQIALMFNLANNWTQLLDANTTLTPRIIIIDSLVCNFRNEYHGRGQLADRQQKLQKHLSDCKQFAIKNDAIVFVTNQVVANPDSLYGGPLQKPVGGNVVGHATTYRFELRKSKGLSRVLKVIDAPDIPISEAVFEISGQGVRDRTI